MNDVQELMRSSAEDALKYSIDNFSVNLDYSIDSVGLVDDIIQEIGQGHILDQDLFTLSYIYGAYLGEVYKRKRQGEWTFVEETDSEPPQVFFKDGDKTFAFPSKVYHVLSKTHEESLIEYMKLLLR
ncbi:MULTISPECIES: hypothetical protein [unclassified Agarivorans]|uniref:hypothetical protein n=1 Tax=unclassified Agarivorans TaxID=2636026 RepID=UPI003D7CFFC0